MDSIPLVTSLLDSRVTLTILFYFTMVCLVCVVMQNTTRADNLIDASSTPGSVAVRIKKQKNLQMKCNKNGHCYEQTDKIICNSNFCQTDATYHKINCSAKSNASSHTICSLLSKNKCYTRNESLQHNVPYINTELSCQTDKLFHQGTRQVNGTMFEDGILMSAYSELHKCMTPNRDVNKTRNCSHAIGSQLSAKAAILSLSICIVPFIPASNLLIYVGFVVAERILYIPSMGFCLLIGLGFGKMWNRNGNFRPTLKIGLFVIIGLFCIRTYLRNEDWKDEESLYRSGLKINPPKAWGNLANILSQQGRILEAEEAYKNALALRPTMADTHYNLGILYQSARRHEEAIKCYKMAIRYRPSLASAYLNLGMLYDSIGRKQDAIEILGVAKNISDFGLKNPKAHWHALTSIRFNMGKILFDLQKYKESVDMFYTAMQAPPDNYPLHSIYNMLGQAYSFLDDTKSAEKWYRMSLEFNQTHVPAHLTFAKHLAAMGNQNEAETWFLRALRLQPNYSDSSFHYGQFLLSVGRHEEGLVAIEKAVELNPNEADLAVFAASAFREIKDFVKAEFYYKKAIVIEPSSAASHMNLGALYHLIGRLEEAEVSYLEALRLNPADELTMTNIRKLRSIRPSMKSEI